MRLKDQLMFVGMLILALSFAVCAQDRQVIDQKSITCKMDFFEAPTLPITGGIQVSPSSGTKWLTLQIFYTPALSYEAGNGKRLRWLDDLSVSAHIIAPAKKEYGGSVLLSGTQVLWSVAEDGQTHQVFFAVPPQIFRRYCELNKFSRSVAQSFPVMVEFRNKNQVLLARYIHSPKNMKNAGRAFQRIMSSNVGFMKLPSAILPKDRTPWNLVEVDAFDLSKNTVEGK